MADPAHEATDEAIRKLSKRLHAEYNRAYKDMRRKQRAAMASQAEADAERVAKVKAGEMTQEELDKWRSARAADSSWYSQMVDTLAHDLATCDSQARQIINGEAPSVYADNYNYGTYQLERDARLDTAFTLVDADTVSRLVKDRPDLLPRLSERPDKSERWARRKITSAVTQSVLTGESVDHAARRIRSVVDMDRRAAVKVARTAMTGAENSGRVASYERARAMGIDVRKRWMATLDTRTRDSHRRLDGESVGTDERFDNGLMYPGDPDGPASEVWNCRCTLVADIPGHDVMAGREGETIGEQSYAQWKGVRSERTRLAGPDEGAEVYAVLGRAQMDAVRKAMRSAPEAERRLYKRFEATFKQPNTIESGTSYYSPSQDRVTINLSDTFDGQKPTGNTWFHEFGHNIDHRAGDRQLSSEWRGGAFPKKLKAEAKAYATKKKAELPAYIESLVRDRHDVRTLEKWNLIDFDTELDYRYNGLTDDELLARCKKPTLNHAYKMIGKRLSEEYTDAQKCDVSDILGGATNNRAVDGWGHFTKGYWDKDGEHLATEAFAEMFSATFTSPESLDMIKRVFPESFAMFEEMVREVAER